jgi:hypothetical protein
MLPAVPEVVAILATTGDAGEEEVARGLVTPAERDNAIWTSGGIEDGNATTSATAGIPSIETIGAGRENANGAIPANNETDSAADALHLAEADLRLLPCETSATVTRP